MTEPTEQHSKQWWSFKLTNQNIDRSELIEIPKATLTITQNDIDIANDICEAIEQHISPALRVKLFNQAVARVAMERLK